MSATLAPPSLPALGSEHAFDAGRPTERLSALLGHWHVIAASRGSISRNPQNVTETFEFLGSRLVSTLSFDRLSGSISATRRRLFDLSANDGDGLWTLIQTSLELVFVDEAFAIVAEGRRLRILSRTPAISPRDFFLKVSLLRERGYFADDLRMIPVRAG